VSLFQRFVLWLAARAGVLPPVTPALVELAKQKVQHSQLYMKGETVEYRRHIAFKGLVESGATPRQAAIAIEVAVSLTK
jgi:hypothetical protein